MFFIRFPMDRTWLISCYCGIWNPATNSPQLLGFQMAMEPFKKYSFYLAARRKPRNLRIIISSQQVHSSYPVRVAHMPAFQALKLVSFAVLTINKTAIKTRL